MMNTIASLVASFVAGISAAPQALVDGAPFRDQPTAETVRRAEPVDIVTDAPTGLRAVSLREMARTPLILSEGVITEGPIASRPLSLAEMHAVRLTETVSDAPTPSPAAERRVTSWNVAQLDVVASVP